MNNISKILLTLLLAGGLVACGNDRITADVSEYLTQDQKEELVKDDKTFASDLRGALLQSNANKLQGGWDSHDDFGLKAYHMTFDLMGEDVVAKGLDWFDWEYNYVTVTANTRRVRTYWNMWYEIIANCNSFINDAPDPSADNAPFYAYRGIAYWHLANFYQATYKGNESKMAVPIMLKDTDVDLARNTVKEVYDQAIKDLTIGIEHCAATKDDHTDMDKYVVAAYLAKLYACMEDWANVEKYAKMAIEGGKDIVPEFPLSWNVNNSDVIWGYDVTPATSTSWASFYSHMDPTNGNYCGRGQRRLIYAWLYDQMQDNDTRRQLFVNQKDYPEIAVDFVDKKTGEKYYYPDYTSMKFVVTNADNLNSDYIFLRVQDPILLAIEAQNELGKTAEAKKALEEFVGKRAEGYTAPADQKALRDEIRIQRRIELWGEGNGVWDMKRWHLNVDRSKTSVKGTQSNHTESAFTSLDPNAIQYIHCLPQNQLDINKNLQQDPRPTK